MRKILLVGILATFIAGSCGVGWAAGPELPTTENPSILRYLGPMAPRSAPLPKVPEVAIDPGREWTMKQALARALEANPDVQVALATIQRQEGIRLQAAAAMLPRVVISASTDNRDGSLTDRPPSELQQTNPLTPRTAYATRAYDARVEVRQTVFDGLAGWQQVKRAAFLRKKTVLDARDAYFRVASQVRQAFDAALFRQQVVNTRRDAARDMARLAEVARKRFSTGQISEFESLRAQSALLAAEADLAQARAELAQTEEVFCRMLYIEMPPGGLRLTGEMTVIDYQDTLETALARARTERMDVRSAELQLKAAVLAQRMVARSALMPKIEAFAHYTYRSSYYDVDRHVEGATLGLVGSWSIFDSGQTLGAIRVQRADRRVAEIRVAEVNHLVNSQVHELYAALAQSRSVVDAQANARDVGERSVREAKQLYEVGRLSLEQVLNAEMAYRQSLLGWLSAVFTHNMTVYQLDYATASEGFLDGVVGTR